MKKISLCILLVTMQLSFAGKKKKTKSLNKNIDVSINSNYSIAVKDALSWGTANSGIGYLGYRAAKKLGCQLPLSWDPLGISVSAALGIIGMGLIDYTYHTAHRTAAMLDKEDYVTGAEEEDNEDKLEKYVENSKNHAVSLFLVGANIGEIRWGKVSLLGKKEEVTSCSDISLLTAVGGIFATSASITSNPVGFKAAYTLIPDAHSWVRGIFAVGLNMLMIKTLYVISKKMFLPNRPTRLPKEEKYF